MNAGLGDSQCCVVGTRQLLRRLAADEIEVLYVARDAQEHIRQKLLASAQEKGVSIIEAESMAQLGKDCGIAVGSAAAGLLRRNPSEK